MAEERFLIKDFFNRETIGVLADAVVGAYPAFDRDGYIEAVLDGSWEGLELKQRMRHAATKLRAHLPDEYPEAIRILRKASPQTEPAGFAAMVLSDFVEAFGAHDYKTSVPALGEFTKVVSAEFAVRPFLVEYPDKMLAQMLKWTDSRDWRLRRLASEGSRPRLPWGMALREFQADPSPILPILEKLRHDPSEDVRRSVANSLNDVAKDHPDVVIETLTGWQDGTAEVADITRHALRTLLKQGLPEALELLGYRSDVAVSVKGLTIDPDPAPIGSKTSVVFVVRNESPNTEPLLIDGVVTYARPKGTGRKVFRWKDAELQPGESLQLQRSVTLQQLSTRRMYPGTHRVEVQVNGRPHGSAAFEVTDPDA